MLNKAAVFKVSLPCSLSALVQILILAWRVSVQGQLLEAKCFHKHFKKSAQILEPLKRYLIQIGLIF